MPPNTMPAPMSGLPPQMSPKKHQNFLVPFILTVLLLLASLIFGFWAFSGQQDYKNNSDKKSAAAVKAAEAALETKKEAEFVERNKEPLKTYSTDTTLGNLVVKYPKSWSSYIVRSERSGATLDAYFHPDYVPGIEADGNAYALHVEVVDRAYDQEMRQYEDAVETGDVSSVPVRVPLVTAENAVGTRLEGEFEDGKTGVIVLFPLRDKTLKVAAEATQYVDDFNTFILPNLSFVP